MKKYVFFLYYLILLSSCGKIVDGSKVVPPTSPTESPISYTINVDPGAGNILAVVGTSQAINVKVTSTIPAAGVTVGVTVTKDLDNSSVFTTSSSSVSADNNITISGLIPGVVCTATIIVTSKSTTNNTKTSIFKLAAK